MPSVTNYGLGITESISAANTTVNITSNAGTNVLYVVSTLGFAVGENIDIAGNTARQESNTIDALTSTTMTLHTNLTFTHTAAEADSVDGDRLFSNSVGLQYDGYSIGDYAIVYFNFYPLESTVLSPVNLNATPSPIAVTIDFVDRDGIIDYIHSTIFGYSMVSSSDLASYVLVQNLSFPPQIVLPIGLTRDMPFVYYDAYAVTFKLYLTSAPSPTPTKPVLLKVTGTDANGVTVSGYTVIIPIIPPS
jgi:hypothetical protein